MVKLFLFKDCSSRDLLNFVFGGSGIAGFNNLVSRPRPMGKQEMLQYVTYRNRKISAAFTLSTVNIYVKT